MWIVFALLAALTAAFVVVLSKAGMKNVDPFLAFAIQSVFILIISWVATASQNKVAEITSIDKKAWYFLIGAGILTAVSSLLTFKALKLGDASIVSPLERLSLVFAVALAAIFLKEKMTWQIITGALLMAGGAVLIAFSKK